MEMFLGVVEKQANQQFLESVHVQLNSFTQVFTDSLAGHMALHSTTEFFPKPHGQQEISRNSLSTFQNN